MRPAFEDQKCRGDDRVLTERQPQGNIEQAVSIPIRPKMACGMKCFRKDALHAASALFEIGYRNPYSELRRACLRVGLQNPPRPFGRGTDFPVSVDQTDADSITRSLRDHPLFDFCSPRGQRIEQSLLDRRQFQEPDDLNLLGNRNRPLCDTVRDKDRQLRVRQPPVLPRPPPELPRPPVKHLRVGGVVPFRCIPWKAPFAEQPPRSQCGRGRCRNFQ